MTAGAPAAKAVNINTDPANGVETESNLMKLLENTKQVKPGDTAIILQQPYGAIASCLAWQCNFEPYLCLCEFCGVMYRKNTGYTTFVIQNSLELLRNPGEFYFDKTDKKLLLLSGGRCAY